MSSKWLLVFYVGPLVGLAWRGEWALAAVLLIVGAALARCSDTGGEHDGID